MSKWVGPGVRRAMDAAPRGGYPAIEGGWFAGAGGTRIRVTAVWPERRASSRGEFAALEAFARDAHARIAARCAGPPPPSIDITLFLSSAPKVLPRRRGAPITPDAMNTGVTSRKRDGACEVLVYRREDLRKTLVHELLHAHGAGDWCDSDACVVRAVKARALEVGFRGQTLPSEALVEFYALVITAEIAGVPLPSVAARTAQTRRALLWHFARPTGKVLWRETSNAFCYVCLVEALLARADTLESQAPDRPNRTLFRNAFASTLALEPPARAGRSLRLFP